jgi:pyrroline-5-carboxylate reductase
LSSYKLGIIGCGNMGEALLKGILNSGFLKSGEILFYDADGSRGRYIENRYKIYSAEGVVGVISRSRYILLAVKPQNIKNVLEQMKDNFDCKGSSIISIIAGRFTTDEDLVFSENLIRNVGDYVIIEEKYQNIAAALNGSGPAYFFLFCKYLIEAGIKNGLSQETAKKLVAGTIIGSGITIEKSEVGLDGLIRMVASPGGTTEKALEEFDRGNLKKIIYDAVESAKKRAKELQDSMD